MKVKVLYYEQGKLPKEVEVGKNYLEFVELVKGKIEVKDLGEYKVVTSDIGEYREPYGLHGNFLVCGHDGKELVTLKPQDIAFILKNIENLLGGTYGG